MNKGKLFFGVIIASLLGVIIFQNQAYFLAKHGMSINFWVVNYQVPETYNVVYTLSFFLLGLFIAYFFALYAKYKSNQIIKKCKADLQARTDTIARLEAENESLKSAMAQAAEETAADTAETVEAPLSATDKDAPEEETRTPENEK